MWLPDVESVKDIHYELARVFENENDPISPVGVKSESLLSSACERPHTGAGGVFKYVSLEKKLAALFHSLTKNHPFNNGNKRTAIVSVLTALYRNNRRFDSSVTDDVLYDFVVSVTADEFPRPNHGMSVDSTVDSIAKWIKGRSISFNSRPTGMKTSEFINKCKKAGAHCKNSSDGAYIVSNKLASIRVSKSTRQISGPAIRKYLNMLNLSESAAGISFDEFQEGVQAEREQMYRYMTALRRLART